jgi:hypothetical protein
MAAFVILTSLVGLGETRPFETVSRKGQPFVASDRPAILHLILDEHIGIEGIAKTNAAAIRESAEIKRAYLAMGFRVYGRAYSRHLHTVNAIPSILNFGQPPSSLTSGGRHGVRVGPNSYFRALERMGYRTKILQSNFADFCEDSKYETCTTYLQD